MTNSSLITIMIASLSLMGAGTAAYSDVKSDLAVANSHIDMLKQERVELDQYDAHLTRDLEEVNGDLIRTQAKQEGIISAQQEIKGLISEMLSEMKSLNENIIRMGVKSGE